MGQKEVVIVGAGLAGLTAAINLAREGREVVVIEKGKRVGGLDAYNPSPHGTPMDADAMSRYTGIDLRPAMVRLRGGIVSVWGKRFPVEFPANVAAWMIERGPRESSMDHYLYRIALEEGVRFEFDRPVVTARQLRDLPRGSIVATGLHLDGFEAADVPCRVLHGCFSKCRVPWTEPRVTMYFDDYTDDYAFTCSVNGVALAIIFNRYRPVAQRERERFAAQAVLEDGYPFEEFHPLEGGAVPVRSFTNPRLFQGDMVLAGTLAGMIDPILLFGMHGAFISGKIAALALSDPAGARAEFRRLNIAYYPLLAAKRLLRLAPRDVLMKRPARLGMRCVQLFGPLAMRPCFKIDIPGYGRI